MIYFVYLNYYLFTAMNNNLTEDFLYELFKKCLKSEETLDVVVKHLKYQYLPTEQFKKFWKYVSNYYRNNQKVPTYGIISQSFQDDKDVGELISNVKDALDITKENLLFYLQEYIKKSMFLEAYDKVAEIYNTGDKENAYSVLNDYAVGIQTFSLLEDSKFITKVFDDFEKRNTGRILEKHSGELMKHKIPTGIDQLDDISGGIEEGDTWLYLGRSGAGKTKLLRWHGVSAARRGYRVLHIQAEGSKRECMIGYDSTWTGVMNHLVETCEYDDELMIKFRKVIRDIRSLGGEIIVHAYEQFDSVSIADVRNLIIELEKTEGHIDEVILDYFELFEPGDGKKYMTSNEGERSRRRALGKAIKNVAIELKTRIVSATQANDITPALLEDPDFVMTRHNVSEFKNVVEPFSAFVTLNQTRDEYRNGIMRLYVDKLRKQKGGQIIKIFQSYQTDRFYDRKRTLEEFYFTND